MTKITKIKPNENFLLYGSRFFSFSLQSKPKRNLRGKFKGLLKTDKFYMGSILSCYGNCAIGQISAEGIIFVLTVHSRHLINESYCSFIIGTWLTSCTTRQG